MVYRVRQYHPPRRDASWGTLRSEQTAKAYRLSTNRVQSAIMASPALKALESGHRPAKRARFTSRARLIIAMAADKPDEPVAWPPVIRYSLDDLTPKQRHFAICVATGIGQVDAYKRAYDCAEDASYSTIGGSASIVASHPKVKESVELILAWLDRDWLLDSQEVVEYGYNRLYEEAENAAESGDRIRAATNLLKAHGAFVSRSEVKHIHVGESSASDQLIDAIGAMLGLAAVKAQSREFITPPDSPAIDVASERVIDQG